MSKHDETYADMLRDILNNGEDKSDRTGTGTRSVFGRQYRYDLRQGFPLLTTKRIPFKHVVGEILWMLSGSTSVTELREKYGVTVWDEWQDSNGTIGAGYGFQWRHFGETEFYKGVDQIADLVKSLRTNPDSRRHIVSAWNPQQLRETTLPPCHAFFQFYVSSKGELSCQLYQRSAA